MKILQANVRAIAKAVKDPAEHARVDQVIRQRARLPTSRKRCPRSGAEP